ncbi:S-layer homology domain-containing protein [Paenibacillus glufosinatiresistens]|uniref:S-layer homology domain-containing protein n=1 Tax=Paenibacillus glufosinatiresistens TaxID=3070657 RepID=UPI00286E66F1|nr:S-layer homology domain-containing protein [Paenibacillus sp. YX.27]
MTRTSGWLAKSQHAALCVLLLISIWAGVIPAERASAAPATLVNVEYNQMNFGVPTLVSGTANQQNAVYRYSNVLTKDGVTVDALLTLTGVTNTMTVGDVDQTDGNASINKRLNPMLTTTGSTGSVDYKIDFVLGGSSNPVSLYNFYTTVIDIDGSSSTRKEFVELAGFTKYTKDRSCGLTISTVGNKTRFLGISSGLPDRSFDNSASAIASYTAPVSTVYVTMGNEGALSDRLFSVNFGAAGGVFSNPQEYNNASSPTITASISDGADGKLTAGDEDLTQVRVSGTTSAEAGQTVNIVVTDSAGTTHAYTATVQSGGYAVDMDVSAWPAGNISLSASVVNQAGNPSVPATDSSVITAKLPAPVPSVSGTVVSWAAVPNAVKYKVQIFDSNNLQIGGDIDNGSSLSIELADRELATGNYTVKVQAVGNGTGYQSSDWSQASQAVTYTSLNDPATGPVNKAAFQYEPLGFSSADFKAVFTKLSGASNGPALTRIRFESLPAASAGKLVLNGTDVAVNQEIPVADIGNLRFVPTAAAGGFSGTVSFQWNGKDASQYAASAAAVTLTANTAPVIGPVTKDGVKGSNLSFALTDFTTASYSDSNSEPLSAIKAVTLPDAASGTLKLNGTPVTAGQIIPAAQVGQLVFVPAPDFTGTAVWQWTASDGKEYAAAPQNVTLFLNSPPVSGTVQKTGLSGDSVAFTAADFTVAPAYSDVEGDALDHITIELPADFAGSGKLWYTSVSEAVYLTPGVNTVSLSNLGSLTFTPDAELPAGSVVTFPWKAHDGRQDAAEAGQVTIAYNGVPVASPQQVDLNEGAGTAIIELQGSDRETVTGLVYQITSPPTRGVLTLQSGSSYLYAPDPAFTSGTDSFSFTVTDADGQTSAPMQVTIQMNKALNGWTGNKPEGDSTLAAAVPGYGLKLSAVSSLQAQTVKAQIEGGTVTLVLGNPSTYLQDGYKQWENTSYLLTAPLAAGTYTATFQAYKADGTLLPAETNLADNGFRVLAYSLSLQAAPDRIVGDGRSTTELSAVLTDSSGMPVPDTEVVFSVPSGLGTFVGSDRVRTDALGRAATTYRSADLSSNQEQKVQVEAEALDLTKGLHAKDEILVTFQPAVVSGFITRGNANEKVAGATVRVTLDLNGDNVITPGVDFDETAVTGADGSYSVAVPKGSAVYTVEVTQNVMVGGVPTPVTYKQTAEVGSVSGTGQENYDSAKTATGIILMKEPEGGTRAVSEELIRKTKVYLKDAATGQYILENGSPKAFSTETSGVFSADGLALGTYVMEIRYEVGPGQEITIQKSEVKVTADGEMNISEELVDPYGAITDRVTGKPVEGATVTLYYAQTARNGSKAGSPVTLPAIPGFAPNDNASPEQTSNAQGLYAYMVYPHTDYYLVVSKPGYETYTSQTIPVETELVRHDISLAPVTERTALPASEPDGPILAPSVSVSLDRNLVEEGGTSTVSVDYAQNGIGTLVGGTLEVTLPEGVVVVRADGGIVAGSTVTWPVDRLAPGQTGHRELTVQWPQLGGAEQAYEVKAALTGGSQAQPAKAASSAKLKVYSNRYGELKHQRYILGYPDGQFKTAKSLTRAELAAIVARLTENAQPSAAPVFKDVPSGHWAANYIRIAAGNAYFSGYADGTFRPEEPVTRGEIAAVMAKFLKLDVKPAVTPHFADLSGHWAANAIESLYGGKFVSGYPDATFKPNLKITRAEAVTMINRMLYRGPLAGLAPQFPDVPASYWAFGDIQEATQSHEADRKSGGETWVRTLKDEMK